MIYHPESKNFDTGAHTPHDHRSAFALTVSIVIMGLVFLLLVSLSTLIQVETRVTDDYRLQAQARNNALLGLQLALGELQKEMGPDSRISANAGILADATEGTTDVNQPHWTGVWEAARYDHEAGDESFWTPGKPDYFRRWLVSGGDLVSATTFADSTSIELVGLGSLSTATDGQVRVPRLEIAASQESSSLDHVAWWIGDEGQKASVSAPARTAGLTRFSTDMTGSSMFPVSVLLGSAGELMSLNNAAQRNLPMNTRGSLPLAFSESETPADLARYFHDITPSSTGLLVNVVEGGHRRDLSFLLEQNTLPSGYRNVAMYDNGPKWDYAHRHYKRYKHVEVETVSGQQSLVLHGRKEFDSSLSQGFNYERENIKDFSLPVASRLQYVFAVFSDKLPVRVERDPDDTQGVIEQGEDERLFLMCYPVVTLWNPYNVTIRADKVKWVLNQIPLELTFRRGGQQLGKVEIRDAFGGHIVDVWTEKVHNEWPVELRPGETRVYTIKPLQYSERYERMVNDRRTFTGSNEQELRPFGGWKAWDSVPGWDEPGLTNDHYGIFTWRLDSTTPDPDHGMAAPSGIVISPGEMITVDINKIVDPNRMGFGNRLSFFLETAVQQYSNNQQIDAGPQGSYEDYIADIGIRLTDNLGDNMAFMDALLGEITPIQNVRVGTFGNPTPLFVFNVDLKTTSTPNFKSPVAAFHDPTDSFVRLERMELADLTLFPYHLEVQEVTSWSDIPLVELNEHDNGYFGSGSTSLDGQNFVSMREIPVAPMQSLPQLRFAALGRDYDTPRYYQNQGSAYPHRGMNTKYKDPAAVFAQTVGNSLAHPYLAPEDVRDSLSADHTYLQNELFWDRYFFSTLTGQTSAVFENNRTVGTVWDDFVAENTPLLNPAYKQHESETLSPAELRAQLFNGNNLRDDAFERIAGLLEIEGAFNINSTSVDAWTAVLSAALEAKVSILAPDSTSSSDIFWQEEEPDNVPVSRFGIPNGGLANTGGTVNETLLWRGYRSLSPVEIRTIAEYLVEEVKARGPFLSLAEFVNRQPRSDRPEAALTGALQRAIDRVGEGEGSIGSINDSYFTANGLTIDEAREYGFNNPEAATRSPATGAPGYIMQADLLTPIAQKISARSDTFLIRAYGDVELFGEVRSKAVCEVLVQRTNEYVSAAENDFFEAGSELNTLNEALGRRFRIISFRWVDDV